MNKDNIISTIKWIVIGIITLLLLKECRTIINTTINNNKPVVKDSIIHTRDTIWARDTIIVFKPKKVFVPQPADTFWKPYAIDTSICHRVFVSRDTFFDKNLDIFTETHYQGLLRALKPSYKLKVPLQITDSVKVIREIPKLYPPTFQIGAGMILGKNIVAPEVEVEYKRNEFAIGYNLINTTKLDGVIVRYNYTIFRK